MTYEVVAPVQRVPVAEGFHPGWCSLEHCRVEKFDGPHESAPIEVDGVMVSVSQGALELGTHPVLILEGEGDDEDPCVVMLRLYHVPALVKALLELYCRLP